MFSIDNTYVFITTCMTSTTIDRYKVLFSSFFLFVYFLIADCCFYVLLFFTIFKRFICGLILDTS
eukprot:UN01206